MLSYEGTFSRSLSLCIGVLIRAHSVKRRIWKSADKNICRGWDSMCHTESCYWVGVDEWLEVVGWSREGDAVGNKTGSATGTQMTE